MILGFFEPELTLSQKIEKVIFSYVDSHTV